MARYEFPSTTELLELGTAREHAVTVYAQASAADYELARTTVKSAMDQAIRTLRESGVTHAVATAFQARLAEILDDDCWQRLSRSLAIFVTADTAEVFVLPNVLENQSQVGRYFDLGQFVRAVATPQEAYALTLSGDGWNLWLASGTAVAGELDVDDDGIGDVAEATNRATVRGRSHNRRLHGDEGTKQLLETYAKRVAEVVERTLDRNDPSAGRPLFLFAADPLADMFRNIFPARRQVVTISGSPDDLRAHQIDAAIRGHLGELNAERATNLVDSIADGFGQGLVAADLADIARAAVGGAIDTLVYDFTVDIFGSLSNENGELTYSDDGYDLLSRIAIWVLQNSGTVVPVRSTEVTSDIWNGTAVARLRYPLVG